MTKQRAWQLRNRAKGLCEICGKPLEFQTHRCLSCLRKKRIHEREKFGQYPWIPGSRGVPPIEER